MTLPSNITHRGDYSGVAVYDDKTTGRAFTTLAGALTEEIAQACHEHRRKYSETPERPRDAGPMLCMVAILTGIGTAAAIFIAIKLFT